MLINKGLPPTPKYTLVLVLIDCINKENFSEEIMQQCIVEVDTRFVLHDAVVK